MIILPLLYVVNISFNCCKIRLTNTLDLCEFFQVNYVYKNWTQGSRCTSGCFYFVGIYSVSKGNKTPLLANTLLCRTCTNGTLANGDGTAILQGIASTNLSFVTFFWYYSNCSSSAIWKLGGQANVSGVQLFGWPLIGNATIQLQKSNTSTSGFISTYPL